MGSGGVVAQPPHGLGKTLGSRLSLDLAPGSTPPSCVPLGQWCKLSEPCVHGRSQSPGHPLGPPEGSLFQAARSAFRFRLPPPTVGLHPARPQEAQGRSSEPSCRGRQTGHRYQGPRGQGEAGRRPHRTWWWGLGGAAGRGGAEEPDILKGVLMLYNKRDKFKLLTRQPDQRAAAGTEAKAPPPGRTQADTSFFTIL